MRKPGLAWGMLVALTLVLLTPGVALAEQENYYLGPDGVPQAQLMLNPLGGEMPNYDRGRDVEPGLLLQRSSLGLAEEDVARFQHWQLDLGGQRVAGYPSMVVWSAADRFEAGQHGVFTVYLLDCDPAGSDCERLGSKVATMDSGAGEEWIETIVEFPELNHTFDQGRSLAVRIVVPSASETDMMFAYGYAAHRSRLTINSEKPEAVVEASMALQSISPPVDFGASPPSMAAETAPVAAPTAAPTVPTTSLWPWLITLALSTAALVALGSALMSSLTKPGRHQPQSAMGPGEQGQSSRISVSAP